MILCERRPHHVSPETNTSPATLVLPRRRLYAMRETKGYGEYCMRVGTDPKPRRTPSQHQPTHNTSSTHGAHSHIAIRSPKATLGMHHVAVARRDSDLEAFSRNPTDGSFAPLTYRSST